MEILDPATLAERSDGFDYGYWMKCSCGGSSFLAAHDYFAQMDQARMTCERCGARIHFGPAVAALRDRCDPVLQDGTVASLAWYHTSTSPDWPSPDYSSRFAEALQWDGRLVGVNREQHILEETTRALHIGTYETAIENMLRRMNHEGDGGAQFYLYRVLRRSGPLRINPGYRDENHEVAAHIRIRYLDAHGLDAVRYLNVHEAMGVLSLAVRPEVIAAVQSIEIPLRDLAQPIATESFSEDVAKLESLKRDWMAAEAQIASIGRGSRRLMQLGARPDPGGLTKRAANLERRHQELWRDFEEALGKRFLTKASLIIKQEFTEALASWRSASPSASMHLFVERYAAMASLLERPEEVRESIRNTEWRAVHQPTTRTVESEVDSSVPSSRASSVR